MPTDSHKIDLRNATQIFHQVWNKLEQKYGRENLHFPKEIMWLGGAPGAGKGTNTPFILRERGLTSPPLVMSDLLRGPDFQAQIDRGHLVGDRDAIERLFEELLKPEYESGLVVDGFPRTKVQVECVRMLLQKMHELRQEFFNTPIGPKFRRPIFRITVLFVPERISIQRQLSRGREIQEHNKRVEETGVGELLPLRSTDLDESTAKTRYQVFKTYTLDALQSLRDQFHYHFIDASGPIREVERKIIEEFSYQSSLELGEDTHDSIRNIPLAGALALHARQELVRRLDNYRHRHEDLFAHIINIIETQIVPDLKRHAAVGLAKSNIVDPELNHPLAIDMVVDILTERGFFPTVELHEQYIPIRVDEDTGSIVTTCRKVWAFSIRFQKSKIRRGG